jgi:hypothetical protein
MIVDQLATPRSNSTTSPNCPECQTLMRLFGIEPEDDHELHSYECPNCQCIKTAVWPLFH